MTYFCNFMLPTAIDAQVRIAVLCTVLIPAHSCHGKGALPVSQSPRYPAYCLWFLYLDENMIYCARSSPIPPERVHRYLST